MIILYKTEEELEELKQAYWNVWANNYIDGGYWVDE